MPQGDMTGPRGQGPMTGRGMGRCRFRSSAAPFRGDINPQDLKPLIKEAVKNELKDFKFKGD